jgi:hypothetical protein
MRLAEMIANDRPDGIRIGTKNGGGFLWCGKAADFTDEVIRILDESTKTQCEVFKDGIDKRKALGKTNKGSMAMETRYVKWVPVMEREVVRAYDSGWDTDRIYVVTGCEKLIDWNPDSMSVENIREDRVSDFVEEIYKGAIRDLRDAYRHLLTAKRIEDRMFYSAQAAALESWIKKDEYGILDNELGLIKEIRRVTTLLVEEDGRAV